MTNENVKSHVPPFGFGPVPALIPPDALAAWTVFEDEQILALNKPGWVVCHPSKRGPRSSLVGAVREDGNLENVHLLHRLDRETTGLVLFAKDADTARSLQRTFEERRITKRYLAILEGELTRAVTVEEPLGPDRESAVHVKQKVRRRGNPSITHFSPVATAEGYTLAAIVTETGKKHQIRAHALWLEHPILADKLYGPDENLYLSFIEHGWTPEQAAKLPLHHHALHAWQLGIPPGVVSTYPDGLMLEAPLDEEMADFLTNVMKIDLESSLRTLSPLE